MSSLTEPQRELKKHFEVLGFERNKHRKISYNVGTHSNHNPGKEIGHCYLKMDCEPPDIINILPISVSIYRRLFFLFFKENHFI